MQPPALLFDLDGTLVDSARDIARALSIISEARGGAPIDAAMVRPLVSLGAATLVTSALGLVAGDPDADLGAFRQVLGALAADPGIVYPGVAAALSALGRIGHPMAIVTNKPESLSRRLLDDLALAPHFAAIVGGDTAAFPKPHRAPIDHALAALGASATNALFIGDSEIDAAAARGCGMPFLLYRGGYGAAGCDAAAMASGFDHFDELGARIAALRGA